jgi:hypothetical protein
MPLSEVLRILDEPVTEIVGMFNNALKAAQGGVFSPTDNDLDGYLGRSAWRRLVSAHADIHFALCGPLA